MLASAWSRVYAAAGNRKHRKTLEAIYAQPTVSHLRFADIEALVVALGGQIKEGEGSRVAFRSGAAVFHTHRPHPGKEAKPYQVEAAREFLDRIGIRP